MRGPMTVDKEVKNSTVLDKLLLNESLTSYVILVQHGPTLLLYSLPVNPILSPTIRSIYLTQNPRGRWLAIGCNLAATPTCQSIANGQPALQFSRQNNDVDRHVSKNMSNMTIVVESLEWVSLSFERIDRRLFLHKKCKTHFMGPTMRELAT